jgi:hypothetical protein
MKKLMLPGLLVGAFVLAGFLAMCPSPTIEHQLTFVNETGAATTVYVAFGANSVVLPANWSSFCSGGGLNCTFPIAANSSQVAPLGGKYLNATIAFGTPVGCGATKAEMNINTANDTDNYDVSLVDGYTNNIKMAVGSTILGPLLGKEGNQNVFGVFPYGCDICVARQQPPCGIPPGGSGCKGGTQYKPNVLCQYQAPTQTVPVVVSLVP